MTFKVITYSSMGTGVAEKLLKSCEVYGYPVEFYGQTEWFRDFRQIKINVLLDHLKTMSEDVVMYTDAPDSWFLRPNILRVYNRHYKGQIVVSANRDHYPATDLYSATEAMFPTLSTLRFICSSQFIGPRLKLIEFFEKMQKAYAGLTDQEGWHVMRASGIADFAIDQKCYLFMNMTGIHPDEMTPKWVFTETKTRPCSIHFGGPKGGDPNAQNMAMFYDRWQAQPPLA